MAKGFLPTFFIVSLLTCSHAHCRFLSTSDGGEVNEGVQQSSVIRLVSSDGSSFECHETYGFLPCTRTVQGNVFLIVVYGYMMFLAAKLLSGGSEILLQVLGPGIVGGLFLPVLGSLPDAAIILELGLATDIWTCYGARIMLISLLPFVIVQLPQAFHTQEGNLAVLVSLTVAIVLLISYSLYQVFQPKSPQSIGWDGAKAGLLLLSGTLIAAVIAEPLVDAVNNFSSASNIPSFFIYGSVTMSNILSLSVFLGLVYCRDLTWNFSAEVLIILVVCITMGLIGSFRTKFPIWMCFVAFGLYPISLFLAYILDYVVGWA